MIPIDILYNIFEYLSYHSIHRLRRTNKLFNIVGIHVAKHISIRRNRWAWANERLKMNKNAVGCNKKNLGFQNFLSRIGLIVKVEKIRHSVVLNIRSVYNTFLQFVIYQSTEFSWFPDDVKCSFLPARLTKTNQEMDMVSCKLVAFDKGNRCVKNVLINLFDPSNIQKFIEDEDPQTSFTPLSETYYLLFNPNSLLKQDGIVFRDNNNLWSQQKESSEHPEYESSRWAMIRSSNRISYYLFIFENNKEIYSSCIIDSDYNCQGNLKSVGAGKYVVHLRSNGDIRIFVTAENTWILLGYDKKTICITYLLELHYDGSNLIILRDLEKRVILINTVTWEVKSMIHCDSHIGYQLYFDFRSKNLHWMDSDEIPQCENLSSYLIE